MLILADHDVAGFEASGWILLVAVLLGLLPVILVVLGSVRSVEAAGVKVAFAAVQEVVNDSARVQTRTLLAMNLGQPPGQVNDSASDTVIETLNNAVGDDVVVVDLKEGAAWWETRLLLLASGATRMQNPKAVVFTAARPDRPQVFIGWARPADLRRRLLEAQPLFQVAVERADRDTILWTLGAQNSPEMGRRLPWSPAGKATAYGADDAPPPPMGSRVGNSNSWEFPWPSPDSNAPPWVMREDRFVPERYLLQHLAGLETSDAQWSIAEPRLRELFDSVLFTAAVDKDDDDERWVATTIGSTSEYFAVTSGGQLVTMVPRSQALNAVLLRVLGSPTRR